MIRINTSVTLLLPFHRYTLKLSHRLLDSVGKVSGFLMRALADGLTMQHLVEVTGLSIGALSQQFGFLEQHHFVDLDRSGDVPSPSLTERGLRMVAVQRLLEGFEPTVWLDAFTLKHHAIHFLTSLNPDQLLQIPEDVSVRGQLTVRIPERFRSYRPFEQLNRLRNVLAEDALTTLLAYFKPDEDALIADEASHWEYSLSRPERDDNPDYFPVAFDQGELSLCPRGADAGRPTLPSLLLPVLGLTRRFGRADGFPWSVDVPPSTTEYLELVSQGLLSGFHPQPEAETQLHAGVALPVAADSAPPGCLATTNVPPGVSSTLVASRHDVRCDIDHAVLSQQMHEYEDILLFSFNHREVAEVEPA